MSLRNVWKYLLFFWGGGDIFVSSNCKECWLLGVFNRIFWQLVDRLAGNVTSFNMCLTMTCTHYNSCCIYFTGFFLSSFLSFFPPSSWFNCKLSLKITLQHVRVGHRLMYRMAGMLESATPMAVELHITVLMGLNWLDGLIGTVRLMELGAQRSYLPACVSCTLDFVFSWMKYSSHFMKHKGC